MSDFDPLRIADEPEDLLRRLFPRHPLLMPTPREYVVAGILRVVPAATEVKPDALFFIDPDVP